MSRRAAREAERRAAEAQQTGQPHPSGVVDFEAHDFGTEFAPDQEFNVGDTQDIWAALTRGSGRPAASGPGAAGDEAFGAGRPQPTDSSVSGELLDRVRDAVLRRGQEPQAPQAPAHRPADPLEGRRVDLHAPVPPQPVTPPARSAAAPVPTRRELRMRQAAEAREDELPADLFVDRGPVPSSLRRPEGLEAPREQQGFAAYDAEDDGYYDEPYAPEPTIAVPALRPMDLEPAHPSTTPVALPQSFAEPAGDDALTFSSPVPVAQAEPFDEYPEVDAAPSFLAPPRPAWEPAPRDAAPAPRPAASPFLPPQSRADDLDGARGPRSGEVPAAFANPQLGPPSEVTDLAGFEALIRKARQQPAPAPAPRPDARPALAWADEEEVQEGFTGLLSRSVQGSHGSPNALIMPNDPQPADLTQAVSGNGDIFVTGSMNLPRRLSTTGTTGQHDSHEVDSMFDAGEEDAAPGVAPVRASRAVSGTGESRIVVSGRRGRGNLVPTVLAVVAGAMALGVLTLLVGSWLLKLF